MATIKAYSDLQQSKKLAEILPLESADMYYEEICNLPKAIIGNYIFHNQCMEDKDYKKLSHPVLSPAWSLAALLNVLPESYQLTSNKEGKVQLMLIHQLEMDYYDNPVDACYELILKLNELNLL